MPNTKAEPVLLSGEESTNPQGYPAGLERDTVFGPAVCYPLATFLDSLENHNTQCYVLR